MTDPRRVLAAGLLACTAFAASGASKSSSPSCETIASAQSPTGTCTVVGAETFPSLASCETTTFSKLPGWCAGDAGAD